MSLLRRFAPIVALVLVALFAACITGCKTTKIIKEYDDQKEDIPESPEDDGPMPPPPT